MTRDIFLASAKDIFRRALADLQSAIDGCTEESLNWRPAGDDTNSLAVLATHSLASTRSWLSIAVGSALPPRERDEEFRAQTGPDDLERYVAEMSAECVALLSEREPVDWQALRPTHTRPSDDPEVPAAWALVHAIEHLREHTGQMLLTRQLWDRLSR